MALNHKNDKLYFASDNQIFHFKSVALAKKEAATSFIKETIAKYQKIDGALLLVGGFAMGTIETTTGADIDKMISLNFKTAYYISRPLYQHMMTNGYGRLVFIGARPALKPEQGKGVIAYALSKSLLFKLAEFLNAEAKGKNVVASVVAPSTIDTPQNRKSMPEAKPDNWVKAEQIAEVLEFICSDKGSPLREPVFKVYNNA